MDRLPGSTIHVYRDDVFRGVCRCAGPASANNSEAAKACQHGGYADWTDADGNSFRNHGECVNYVAQGGTLAPVAPTLPPIVLKVMNDLTGAKCGVEVYQGSIADGLYWNITTRAGLTMSNGQIQFWDSSGWSLQISWLVDGFFYEDVTFTIYTDSPSRGGTFVTSASIDLQC